MANSAATEDLDREWRPNNRPQSTMAQNFSAALDDLFQIDGGIDNLSKNVFQKKQEVTTQNAELEALEARLRDTEARLKKASNNPLRNNAQRREGSDNVKDGPGRPVNGAQRHDSNGRPTPQNGNMSPSVRLSQQKQGENQANGREYVLVDRPTSKQNGARA